MSIWDDLYLPRRELGALREVDLIHRKLRVEWSPEGECDWPICFEFYPDYHFQEIPELPLGEPYEIETEDGFKATVTPIPSQKIIRPPSDDLNLGKEYFWPDSGMGVLVQAFYDRVIGEYRFEFSREERAFSIGFIEGPLGRFWFMVGQPADRSPKGWKTSEPLLRMLTVISRAFEEIIGGLELHPGALVRVGYPPEEV